MCSRGEDNNEPNISASSLSSLGVTQSGAHGMDLDIAATHDTNAPLDNKEALVARGVDLFGKEISHGQHVCSKIRFGCDCA